MRAMWLLSAAAVICWVVTAQAQNKVDKEPAADGVAKLVKELIERDFYRSVDFPSFAGKRPTNADIDKALADLNASHTRRLMPGTVDYYEVADIFRSQLKSNGRFAFPPYGEVKYDGIGIATAVLDGKIFVTDVYDGSIAGIAGILVGDEIVSVDGNPFDEIKSFEGRAGKISTVTVRRVEGAPPTNISVMITPLSPVRMYLESLSASARIIESRGRDIGYVRIWTFGSPLTNETIEGMMRDGILSQAEGLVLDLRGRWGGISTELPPILMEDFAEISSTSRSGYSFSWREAWRKPIVALINEDTRSAGEVLACAVKKRGVTLVGKKSAGAVLGARAYVLPDKSLLIAATSMLRVDDEILEGKGVVPDIVVNAPVPYAMGADPQLEAAVEEMVKQLSSQRPSRRTGSTRCSAEDPAKPN